MEENTEENNEFSTLQNVEINPKVTTLADLKKKRDLLLEKKKLILMKQKEAIVATMHSDLNFGQNINNIRTTDGDLDMTSSAVFLASCDTVAFDINNIERSIDVYDNDFIKKIYYTTTTSEENLLPTACENAGCSNFESIPDLTSESSLSGSNYKNMEITNVAPIEEVVDDQLNPESELEPIPLASMTPEDNSALPQRDELVHDTGLSCTFDNINDSFPERELEPECSRESRKRQHKANTNNKRTKNKKLRMDGKEYTGFRNTGNKKYIQDSIKPARKLGETCGSVKCLRSQVIHCEKFTESERQNIFEYFWKLSWQEKKMFVCNMIDSKETTRKTTSRQKSRRVNTKVYYLKLNEQRERVCQKTFLRTLGLKEWTVRYWMGEKPAVGRVNDERLLISRRALLRNSIRTFLRALPKLPSHYCRKDSTKLYLEPLIQSKRELYRIYVKDARNKSENIGSRKLFEDILRDENIALFQPKKDACDLCCSYKVGNVSEETYREHILRKDLARKEKTEDKVSAKNGRVHVITADLQAVKLCPYLTASALYFKTKLMVHNFTVYNLGNDKVVCYWFDETTADLKATTYATFYEDYLIKMLDEDPKDVIIFTDGCTSQNRNAVISNTLLRLAMRKNVTITQKILEKGHTQMEVDSVHSVIERKLKNREIYLPSQYASITKEARLNPSPYEVVMPDHTFFKDFSVKNNLIYESIRPGRGAGAKCVVDIRVLKYNPDGTIEYKLNYNDDFEKLPQRSKRSRVEPVPLPQLFQSPLPISKTKYDHLQQLKEVIPRDCHKFYDNLPFKN